MPQSRRRSQPSHRSHTPSSKLPRGSRPDRLHARKRRYVRLYGTLHVERRLLWRISLTVLICVLLLAAVFWSIKRHKATISSVNGAPLSETVSSMDTHGELKIRPTSGASAFSLEDRFFEGDLSDLAEALRGYFAHFGSFEVESYSFQGTLESEQNGLFDFELYGRAGGLARQTLKKDGHELMGGISPEGYWQRFDDAALPLAEKGIEALDPWILQMQASYYSILWVAESQGMAAFEWGNPRTADVNGRECWVIVNRALLDQPVSHYIDQIDGLERLRRAKVPVDGMNHELEVAFLYDAGPATSANRLPHRDDGVVICGIEVRIDSKLMARATVTSMRINLGMPNWFFTPSEL